MKSLQVLRAVSFCEGLSYLTLFMVAMPLKYGLDLPIAVTLSGGLHGALFVALVPCLLYAAYTRKWSVSRSLSIFVAALLPFGFILADRKIARELRACAVPSPEKDRPSER